MTVGGSTYPSIVYADTNFLVCLFYRDHDLHPKAQSCYFQLRAQGTVLAISSLVLDETWFKLVSCSYKRDNPNKKIDAKKVAGCIKKYSQRLHRCHNFVTTYSRSGRIRLVGTDYDTVDKAFNLMSSVPLSPRDAFHAAMLQQENINTILTADQRFEKVPGIEVCNWSQKLP